MIRLDPKTIYAARRPENLGKPVQASRPTCGAPQAQPARAPSKSPRAADPKARAAYHDLRARLNARRDRIPYPLR